MEIETTKPTTLIESTYTKIKQDIIENYLLPGTKIIVRELSERYSVSETPIKQALNRLVTEGLVESTPRKGMRVKMVSWSEIDDVMELRLMFDLYFVDEVIKALKDNTELKQQFEENLNEHLKFAQTYTNFAEYQNVYKLDRGFHELYLACTGNRKAVEVYQRLNSHLYSNYLYERQPRSKVIAGATEHRETFEALCQGDSEKVKENLVIHSKNAKDIIYKTLKESNLI